MNREQAIKLAEAVREAVMRTAYVDKYYCVDFHEQKLDLAAIVDAHVAQAGQPEPVAWIRFCSDGCYEGPIMHSAMEEVRKKSGAWTPLYTAPPAVVVPDAALRERVTYLLHLLMYIDIDGARVDCSQLAGVMRNISALLAAAPKPEGES